MLDPVRDCLLRPGDVDLRGQHDRHRVYQEISEVHLKEREKQLPELEKRLDYVESLGPINTSHSDESYSQHMIETITSYFGKQETSEELSAHYSTQPEFEHARAKVYEGLKDLVLDTKATLQQWYARRDGLPVPFESYIMLTISNHETKERKYIEFVKYEKKLFEALNYLMARIFENRRYPVAVKVLVLFPSIFRLTPGLRIQIEEMQFEGEADRAFTELAPYIEESSYSLKCLKVDVHDLSIFQHLKLRSAEHLVIVGLGTFEWLPIYLNLENHKVHIMGDYFEELMPVDDFMALIRHWISCRKEVGASFRYPLKVGDEEELERKVFKRIKKQFKNSISGHRNAKIPTDNSTTLKVSVEASGNGEEPWDIVLQILQLKQ